MSKQFRNALCACGSGKKHKNCCKPFLDRGLYEQTEEVVTVSVIGACRTAEKKSKLSEFQRSLNDQCEEEIDEGVTDGGGTTTAVRRKYVLPV